MQETASVLSDFYFIFLELASSGGRGKAHQTLSANFLAIYRHPNPTREKQSIAWHELVLFGLLGLYYILFILISFHSSFLFCLVFLKLRIQESVDLAFYIYHTPRKHTAILFESLHFSVSKITG